ncbi:hypothetical protein HELRODRAFT_164869 [Helobdella robusta]|uniref:EGF-like domain-containing protein n=1 Tax=Helobdella robusta TaxID=6412 RepID=T1EVW5_HELRO|nr:hypothetical protein HELRODRAFT_164869 [Helobdella robusta]ESN92763.1 hypothetical protein HELRODRAFT_164869 [Helobdella robusta]
MTRSLYKGDNIDGVTLCLECSNLSGDESCENVAMVGGCFTNFLGNIPQFCQKSCTGCQANTDIYVSNDTCIMRVSLKRPISTTPMLCQTGGNIVALEVDMYRGMIFWGDNINDDSRRGLYRAYLDASNITRIISDDIGRIEGISLDVLTGSIYWTDAERGYIESSDYNGRNRRIVVHADIIEPRSLIVDPLNGWLMWNDQQKKTIEMSRKLFFTDAGDQSIKSITLMTTTSTTTSNNNNINNNNINHNNTVSSVKYTGNISLTISAVQVEFTLKDILNKTDFLFGLFVSHDARTLYTTTWEQNSLIKDSSSPRWMTSSSSTASCKCYCPSYGNKIWMGDELKCQAPTNYFLIADMMSIKLLGADLKGDRSTYMLLTAGHSSSFSAVAFDAKRQLLLFSDVNSRVIMTMKTSDPPSSSNNNNNTTSSQSSKQQPLAYSVEGVVDDMLIHGDHLYWLANDAGIVARVLLASLDNNNTTNVNRNNNNNANNNTNSDSRSSKTNKISYETLYSNLSLPKNLVLYEKSMQLYWTCDNSPSVWMMNLNNTTNNNNNNNYNNVITFNITSVARPVLYIDQANDSLFVLDKYNGLIQSCNLANLSSYDGKTPPCSKVTTLPGSNASLFYSFLVKNAVVYYVDWNSRAFYAYNWQTKRRSALTENLSRPTRFLLHHPSNLSDNCRQSPCVNGCNPIVGGYFCSCPPDQVLSYDGFKCMQGQFNQFAATEPNCRNRAQLLQQSPVAATEPNCRNRVQLQQLSPVVAKESSSRAQLLNIRTSLQPLHHFAVHQK